FLAALEKDAKERAQRRRRNEQLANALKEQGNEAFRAGDFALAIQRYSEGLEKLRDKQDLYTNRAQAYLKLHEYEKAISDCEFYFSHSLRTVGSVWDIIDAPSLFPALFFPLKSRQCYEKMLQIDPQKENLYKECVDEARLEEKRLREEQRAQRELQAGSAAASSIQELLQSISSPGHDILYYTGATRLLAGAVNSCTGQTFFRTNNGFSILRNETVRGAFCAESKSPAEVELCVSLLLLWQAACAGNEENQRLLLAQPEVGAQLAELLSSGTAQLQRETLALISLFSEHQSGRRLLLRQDLSRWLQILMAFVKCTDARADSAMNILSDLIEEKRFQAQCRATFSTDVLPLFTQLLVCASQVKLAALARGVAVLGSLCADVGLRAQLAESRECWQACLQLLVSKPGAVPSPPPQCVFAVLGLMMNLLLESNGTIQDFAVPISGRCLALLSHQDGKIVTRATGVLSRVLPASPSAVEEVVKGGVVKKMLKFLKVNPAFSFFLPALFLPCSQQGTSGAAVAVPNRDFPLLPGFQVLLGLLQSGDELTVGNAAFCLSQCLLLPGAASSLLGSSVVQLLLRQAGGDALRSSVQQNSAIALGRLCVAEPRHIHQLRKLNGLAILNSSMKYVQSS
ncbi:TTC12 protein, partial [Prunella himalayana]|nr:TTC12 protein [Prunella himalayana]